MPPFIHLRVHSAYSLLEGAIGIKELVKWCVKHGMPAVALADSGNLFGSLEFAMSATDAGVQPIMGCTLFLKPEETAHAGHALRPDQLPVYAQDETGWRNLLALCSKAYLSPAGAAGPLLAWADLEGKTDGLIALTGGMQGTMGRYLISGQRAKAEETLARLMRLFPQRLYIELMRHELPEETRCENALVELAVQHDLPLVATNDAYFIEESMFEAHDAFLCIAEGSYVGEEKRRRLTPEHRLKTPAEMCALFADVPEALENTAAIARRCAYAAPMRKPILPCYVDDAGNKDADSMLRQNAETGLEERLERYVFTPAMDEAARRAAATPYRERLSFELDTIIRMQFPGYFLIVSDFIKWSKANGIPVGPGRGSGAGSVVAWALSITDLDPLRYGLLFERFLNPERVSMPDFDVDFCQDRRDEVIAYVAARYGADRVAQIITFGKLQARAVLRDVGRVLQMPYGQVDKISKLVPMNPAHPVTLKDAIDMEPMLQSAIRDDESVAKLVDISLKLEGLNRHASTHAAGVVIGDRPLVELVPMYRDPKSDMLVVQYSMKYAEAAGLVKFDFLGLKTLTVLALAADMIRGRGIPIDLLTLPEGDAPTYAMLGRGETVGVFQLEGAGMRDTVKRLRPDRLEDIIALVSLYRPGPMDNIPTYIARKHGSEKPEYLHPRLEPILKETFGVIIYQEQVMQIAQLLAGYSLGEADLLRRAMGKKIRAEMEAQRGHFVERAVGNGVERNQAASIFDLIAKFAEYGFNKSHAAAYAVVAYQTAYLKANYTVEFLAASMTYDMHNTDKLGIFREEAERFGIRLLPPDINKSGVNFAVERSLSCADARAPATGLGPAVKPQDDGNIRYALSAIRNVGAGAMGAVVEERLRGGAYRSIFDFMTRVSYQQLNKRAMEFLIKAGAFDALHANRASLYASLDMLFAVAESAHHEKESQQTNLFGGDASQPSHVPELSKIPDWPSFERLHMEFESIGFYLSAHPLDAYRKALTQLGVTGSSQLPARLGDKYAPVKVAGIVTARKFKVSDKGRFAFVTLSDLHGVFECSIFSEELLNQHRDKLEVGRMLLIAADGKREEGGFRLIAQAIHDLEEEVLRRGRSSASRLRIVVDNTLALPQISGILPQAKSGAQVVVAAKVDAATHTEIALPGSYAVSPALLDRLRVMPGVVSAEET